MAYFGNTPTTQNFTSGTDYFSGTGSQTAFTLTRVVNSPNDIEVVINNVVQQPNSAYTLNGTTITFTSAPSTGTQNIYVRYLSTATQVVTPSQNSVGYNQLTTDVQNDLGISFKNRIINGDMRIDQRNAGASVTPINTGAGTYTMDRWGAYGGQASKFSVQQNAGSITPPAGFKYYAGITSLSSYSVLSTDIFQFYQQIEGFNWADMGWGTANAKTVTLSFWVRSSLTGTFGGSLYTASVTRSYPFSYSIPVANTWTQISVTIAGDTNVGTWNTTNGSGVTVSFSLGAGSTYSGTANVWQSGIIGQPTGATSVVGTNGATFYLTGVQLEVGSTATPFDTRAYGTELALCQRYFYKIVSDDLYTGFCGGVIDSATTVAGIALVLPVTMRSQPTVDVSTLRVYDGSVTPAITAVGTNRSSRGQISISLTASGGGLTVGRAGMVQSNNSTSAYISASAEL